MSNKKELIDDALDKIVGGAIKEGGYEVLIRNYILCSKDAGWDVNQAVDFFTDAWIRNSDFKQNYTDGKSQDMFDAIDFIRNNYDNYNLE